MRCTKCGQAFAIAGLIGRDRDTCGECDGCDTAHEMIKAKLGELWGKPNHYGVCEFLHKLLEKLEPRE